MTQPTPRNAENRKPCPFTCPDGNRCASVGNLHRLHRCKDRECACHDEWRAYFDNKAEPLAPAPASDALEVA